MKRLYYTIFEEGSESKLVGRKKLCQINEFKEMFTGHQYDVKKQRLREKLQEVYILLTPEQSDPSTQLKFGQRRRGSI